MYAITYKISSMFIKIAGFENNSIDIDKEAVVAAEPEIAP